MNTLTGDAKELIKAALVEAADQLDALQQELATLQDTVLQLQQFIQAGQALVDKPERATAVEVDRPMTSGEMETYLRDRGMHEILVAVPGSLPTAAERAQAMLEEVGRPMTLREMETYLRDRGLLSGKAPLEALQSALRHKSTLFWRVGRGVYGLQAWRTTG